MDRWLREAVLYRPTRFGEETLLTPLTSDEPTSAPGSPEASLPPGVTGPPGWLLKVVKDQRVAFLAVGAVNTVVGMAWFILFQSLIGHRWGYLTALPFAYVASVLCAFVLYRYVVFRVRGHVLRDLLRFATVYVFALGVNFILLPLLVQVGHVPVLPSQALIVLVTSTMSWIGHKNFSFRRRGAHTGPQTGSPDHSQK